MFGQRKELSRARRWSRIAVWVTFGVVLTVRFLFPPEPPVRWRPGQEAFNPNRQFRRPPTRVHPPASKVPADLWRLEIAIGQADVNKLRGYYWNGWRSPAQERPEVLATVVEAGIRYTNVALHLKGAAGSFRPFDDKPALTLNFSKRASGQRFHGYSKISLNNSVQDPSYLSEAISRELFEAAGVPVPRAGHATVLINGRDLGLYVLTEGFGKPFLKRYFKNVQGNLYDGGFLQDITGRLAVNSGDNPDDRSDLDRLAQAAMEPDPAIRWQRLSKVLDMDRFLSFLAMEIMTCHWDGYGMNRNNYRLFHNQETDRMVFIPHGMDQMFGVFRSSPNSPIEPAMQGLVARAVVTTPEGRRLYFDRIATLRTNIFVEAKLTNRVYELSQKIRPTLAAYAPDLAAQHDNLAARLCQRIADRAQSISEQLAAPKESIHRDPIQFDTDGVSRLSGWAPGMLPQAAGRLQFGRQEQDGKATLHIAVGGRSAAGSWRKRVVLIVGRYRFEGRARTSGVGRTGGVCLRISGRQVNSLATSEGNEWIRLGHQFVVHEPMSEVQLVCELRAGRGEAWFEEGSLRLVRE